MDYDKLMSEWDYWRSRIANGDKSSAPRDWFESIIEQFCADNNPTEQKCEICGQPKVFINPDGTKTCLDPNF